MRRHRHPGGRRRDAGRHALLLRLWLGRGRARGYGRPLLAGEFGASVALNAPARLAWLKAVREALETSGIGWALWGYDDSMGFAITPPPRLRPTLDRSVL